MRVHTLTLALLLALQASCSSDVTSVRVAVHYDPAWKLDSFKVAVGGKSTSLEVGPSIRLLLPDDFAGQMLSLDLTGMRLDSAQIDQKWAHGAVPITPIKNTEIQAELTLARLPCGAWCTTGSTECAGDKIVSCAQRDDDECLEWDNPTSCPASAPYCSHGVCAATCVDECAMGETRCDGPMNVKVCGQGDSDPCNDWLPSTACASGEVCSNGACAKICQDECTAGSISCLGAGTITCGDLDDDGCLEWGPIVPCSTGNYCTSGKCQAGCTDECQTSMCNGLMLSACGNYDLDPCKDLSPGVSCVPADPCVEGMCMSSACQTTPKVCAVPPASFCVDGSTQRSYDTAGMCMNGDCDYPSHDTHCAGGCMNGACIGDPCASIMCNTPPAATCASTTTLRSYGTSGTCKAGICSYPSTDTPCTYGCASGACAPCTGAACPSKVELVTTGAYFSCGVKVDGTLVCWGDTYSGELTPPSGIFTSVSAGNDFACALKASGSVVCWRYAGAVPSDSFTSISLGGEFACGIRTDGTLACWGDNGEGQVSPPNGTFSSVSSGFSHACAIKTDGTLACWGHNSVGQASPPSGSFSAISAGWEYTCGIKTDGTLTCWGDSSDGKLAPPVGTFTALNAGYTHTCGIKTDGSLACWGSNSAGVLNAPAGSFGSVSVGLYINSCAIKLDGSVVCWGSDNIDTGEPPPAGLILRH